MYASVFQGNWASLGISRHKTYYNFASNGYQIYFGGLFISDFCVCLLLENVRKMLQKVHLQTRNKA